MVQILKKPVANFDSNGKLEKLHCGTPSEKCNLDDAKDQRLITWPEAFSRAFYGKSFLVDILCHYCFGGEGDD